MHWDVEYTDEFEALVGGSKKGDDRWYEANVPIAEQLYANHLVELIEEGLIDEKEVS